MKRRTLAKQSFTYNLTLPGDLFKTEFFPEMAKLNIDVESLINKSSEIKELVMDDGSGLLGLGLTQFELGLLGVLIIALIIGYLMKSKN